MFRFGWPLVTIVAAIFVSSCPVQALDVGTAAPDFTLKSPSGEASLSQFAGKVVYLDIWASWCSACRHSLPWMSELQTKFGEQGLQVLAVNVDEEESDAKALLEETQAKILVLFDPKGSVPEQYHASSMPSSYLIDRAGKVLAIHDGIDKNRMQTIEQEIAEQLSRSE